MALSPPPASPPPSLAERTRRKIALRILPFIFVLYIINFLDRANLGYVKSDMVKDLGFGARSDEIYGLGAGIFFIGYLILEIPGTLIVERWSARRWIARILISWGFCTALVGLVHTEYQFYGARFLLGLAEAGFFPGVIVYLTHWFAPADRARAMAGLILAVPVALGLGAPLSWLLLHVDWLGLPGWRWVLIVEGLPAIGMGVVTLFYLTDRPHQAHWLAPEERDWIIGELEAEKQHKRSTAHITIWQAFHQRNVLLLAVALFGANMTSYPFVFWLTTILNESGLDPMTSTLYSGLPYVVGMVAAVLASRSSDRTGERKWHAVIPLVLMAVFFSMSTLPGQRVGTVIMWLSLTAAAIYAYSPAYWVLPTLTLSESAAAASIGLINSCGNFSGYLSQHMVGQLRTWGLPNKFLIPIMSLFALGAAACIAAVEVPPRARGRGAGAAEDPVVAPVEPIS